MTNTAYYQKSSEDNSQEVLILDHTNNKILGAYKVDEVIDTNVEKAQEN